MGKVVSLCSRDDETRQRKKEDSQEQRNPQSSQPAVSRGSMLLRIPFRLEQLPTAEEYSSVRMVIKMIAEILNGGESLSSEAVGADEGVDGPSGGKVRGYWVGERREEKGREVDAFGKTKVQTRER